MVDMENENKFLKEINSEPLSLEELAEKFPHMWVGVEDIEKTKEGHVLKVIVRFIGDRLSLLEKQIETNNRVYFRYSTPDDDSLNFIGYNAYGGRVNHEN